MEKKKCNPPIVISTWYHGEEANLAAVSVLEAGGTALDAVVEGAAASENNPAVLDVGYGGLPDEYGIVTLDAAVMGPDGRNGSVAGLRDIKNAAAVARKVMEETTHAMIVGEGAKRFALEMGFEETNLLTEKAKERWSEWKNDPNRMTGWSNDISHHETLGIVAIDKNGDLAGVCTTSGAAWKIQGRVGDSPIIGAGLYVDNNIGAAAATGAGREIITICGSFLIVEKMRQGSSAQEACEVALQRIIDRHSGNVDFQVGFVAIKKNGQVGAASIMKPFQYALYSEGENSLHEANAMIDRHTDFYQIYR